MKRVKRNIPGERGFTLIELLSATAISAILIISLNTVLYNAFNMRDRSYESVSRTSAQQYAVSVMKRDLKQMLPPSEALESEIIGEDIGGRDMPISQLEFYTTSGAFDSSQPWSDVQRVEYTLKEIPAMYESGVGPEDSLYLVRSIEQNVLAQTDDEPPVQALLADVRGFMVSYYDGESWSETWDSSEMAEDDEETALLPQAVRVQLILAKPSDEAAVDVNLKQQPLEQIEFLVPITMQSITQPEEDEETAETASSDGENNNPNSENNNDGQSGGTQR
ncbi:MAG: type II secretion system protein GspJ [Candidatus Hinthialibacter antarcticus]|nr:type II secretion system protein GspJ [Candidatus Hinthialibacter antarcticus]